MDTFLLRLPKRPNPAQAASVGEPVPDTEGLQAALERVLAALPKLGMGFLVHLGQWAHGDVRASWALSQPATGSCLISLYDDEDCAAIAYGEVFGARSCAAAVANTYHASGAEGVQQLDGCFGAVIWDKRRERVVVGADLIGQRALRFSDSGDALWVSPHETCLVAAGAASVSFDPVSALSCVVHENSLLSKSLLRDVTGLAGHDVLTWHPRDGLRRSQLPRIDLGARIDARDQRARAACRTAVVDRVVMASEAWARSASVIKCELTAGIDSRASLACLLAANVGDRVTAITRGGPDNLDMKTARELARLAGVRHETLPPENDDPADFLAHLRLRAFTMNGETDAKRATRPLPSWRPDDFSRVEGTGGEVYRGFYYPYFGPTGTAPDSVSKVVSTLLTRRSRRFATTPVAAPEYRDQLRARLRQCFDEYAALSPNGNDMLDLYYLFERIARWSAHVRRSTWSSTRNVFLVPSAIREAYRMPSPWGTTVNLHSELIRRHFPKSRWVLINGAKPIDLEGPGRLRMATRLGLTVGQTLFEKASRRLTGKTAPNTTALLFAGPLHEALQGLLSPPSSVATLTFGQAGTQRILDEHRTAHKHTALLGYAATLDAYRELLLAVQPSRQG